MYKAKMGRRRRDGGGGRCGENDGRKEELSVHRREVVGEASSLTLMLVCKSRH